MIDLSPTLNSFLSCDVWPGLESPSCSRRVSSVSIDNQLVEMMKGGDKNLPDCLECVRRTLHCHASKMLVVAGIIVADTTRSFKLTPRLIWVDVV